MTQTFPAIDAPAAGAEDLPADGAADVKPALQREKNASVTFYVAPGLRNRARATYRATSVLDGDSSWSDMVRKALVAEIERRELLHNAGRSYVPDDTPLPAGRPLASS